MKAREAESWASAVLQSLGLSFRLLLSPVKPEKALPPPVQAPGRSLSWLPGCPPLGDSLLPGRGPCLAAGQRSSAAPGGYIEPPWGQSPAHVGSAGCGPGKGPRRPGRWQTRGPERSPRNLGTCPGVGGTEMDPALPEVPRAHEPESHLTSPATAPACLCRSRDSPGGGIG